MDSYPVPLNIYRESSLISLTAEIGPASMYIIIGEAPKKEAAKRKAIGNLFHNVAETMLFNVSHR